MTILEDRVVVAGALTMTESPKSSASHKSEDFQQFRSYLPCWPARPSDAETRLGSTRRTSFSRRFSRPTSFQAYQKQAQFRGASEADPMGWLRQILANNLADAVRGLARVKRDASRERSLDYEVDDSFTRVDGWLAAVQSPPSQQAVLRMEVTVSTLQRIIADCYLTTINN
jgi:hypothetical protein